MYFEPAIMSSFSNVPPLKITWFDCSSMVDPETIGIGDLPGLKFKSVWRNLEQDIRVLKDAGVTDIFCVCKASEMKFFRVRELFDAYHSKNLIVHHYPIEPDVPPDYKAIRVIVEDIWNTLLEGHKVYIHGRSHLGRVSVVLAAFLMELEETCTPARAIFKIRELIGNGAFQTMQQYNFVDSFREYQAQHIHEFL